MTRILALLAIAAMAVDDTCFLFNSETLSACSSALRNGTEEFCEVSVPINGQSTPGDFWTITIPQLSWPDNYLTSDNDKANSADSYVEWQNGTVSAQDYFLSVMRASPITITAMVFVGLGLVAFFICAIAACVGCCKKRSSGHSQKTQPKFLALAIMIIFIVLLAVNLKLSVTSTDFFGRAAQQSACFAAKGIYSSLYLQDKASKSTQFNGMSSLATTVHQIPLAINNVIIAIKGTTSADILRTGLQQMWAPVLSTDSLLNEQLYLQSLDIPLPNLFTLEQESILAAALKYRTSPILQPFDDYADAIDESYTRFPWGNKDAIVGTLNDTSRILKGADEDVTQFIMRISDALNAPLSPFIRRNVRSVYRMTYFISKWILNAIILICLLVAALFAGLYVWKKDWRHPERHMGRCRLISLFLAAFVSLIFSMIALSGAGILDYASTLVTDGCQVMANSVLRNGKIADLIGPTTPTITKLGSRCISDAADGNVSAIFGLDTISVSTLKDIVGSETWAFPIDGPVVHDANKGMMLDLDNIDVIMPTFKLSEGSIEQVYNTSTSIYWSGLQSESVEIDCSTGSPLCDEMYSLWSLTPANSRGEKIPTNNNNAVSVYGLKYVEAILSTYAQEFPCDGLNILSICVGGGSDCVEDSFTVLPISSRTFAVTPPTFFANPTLEDALVYALSTDARRLTECMFGYGLGHTFMSSVRLALLKSMALQGSLIRRYPSVEDFRKNWTDPCGINQKCSPFVAAPGSNYTTGYKAVKYSEWSILMEKNLKEMLNSQTVGSDIIRLSRQSPMTEPFALSVDRIPEEYDCRGLKDSLSGTVFYGCTEFTHSARVLSVSWMLLGCTYLLGGVSLFAWWFSRKTRPRHVSESLSESIIVM